MTTSILWKLTHESLLAGNWSDARSLLDELGRRRDNHDSLSSAATYGVPEMIRQLIQDRINLVNSHV